MKKNVVVITGSPRKGGNSEALATAFIQGAQSVGHEVAKFDAAADPVHPCRACDACWSKGKACVFDDGFTRLAPLLENADVIVLCGPVYWFSHSAQLTAAIDKFYAFTKDAAPRKLQGTMYLLLCAEDTRPEVFFGVKQEFHEMHTYLEMANGGELLVNGVGGKGDIPKTDALTRAEQMGRELT